ncbi:MAG TPA: tetratricopeptide repeat protein [Ferruginibacter sp.]|nr:tetratricopeptide repeat protein [Ferruginibacter sp.]
MNFLLRKEIGITLVFLWLAVYAFAQTKTIEQLKQNVYKAPVPAEQLRSILLLCEQGYSLHPDTLMWYAAYAEKLAKAQNNTQAAFWAQYHQSAALTNKGLTDSAEALADDCLERLKNEEGSLQLVCNLLNQKGRCYVRKNQHKEAIEMGYAILSRAEKINDVLLQVKARTLIGWAYLEMGQLRDALNWHLKALHTTADSSVLEKYAILYANLATNYNGLGITDSAFYYIQKAVDCSRKYENLFALSNSLAIYSALNVNAGHPSLSEPLLKEVVTIRKLIGDPFYTASDLAQLGYYYAHYGQPEKGIAVCLEGIELAKKYRLNTKLFFLYGSLADNYKAMGNTAKYASVLEDILALKDSVYEQNSAQALAEMQTKFEVQKKENTIIQQKFDLVTKNYWLYGSMILSVFIVVAAFIIFQLYRKRQQLKLEIALAEEKRLAATAVKEAEENERKRIAADLHDNLGAYAASIVANIDTISQQTAFNNTAIGALKELHSNSQSIVSQLGDTIWMLKRNVLTITAVSDRIKLLLHKVQPSYAHISIDVEENIKEDYKLLPSQGFHLFQVIQEAVINALRHSDCSALKVSFTETFFWEVTITDNGKGMVQPVAAKSGGNGLQHMLSRAKDAGFTIQWLPADGGGTTVQIRPATTN